MEQKSQNLWKIPPALGINFVRGNSIRVPLFDTPVIYGLVNYWPKDSVYSDGLSPESGEYQQ
jgi:hypothetical protein